MSSFFSNLFGGNKNKKSKQNVAVPKNDKKVEKPPPSNEDDDIPTFSRRFSLSKSGRMKERKRQNVAVTDFPIENKENKAEDDISCDLPDSDIFDTHGIIEEIKSSISKENKSSLPEESK